MAAETWKIDTDRSEVRFSLRHIVFAKIEGKARIVEGVVRYDARDPIRSSATVSISAASVDTGDPERDDHFRSAELLDAQHFPEIRFDSQRITALGEGRYSVAGILTLRDQTHDVNLEVKDLGNPPRTDGASPPGRIGPFAATATINRQRFGLHWNQDLDTGGVVVGDKIELTIRIELDGRGTVAGE